MATNVGYKEWAQAKIADLEKQRDELKEELTPARSMIAIKTGTAKSLKKQLADANDDVSRWKAKAKELLSLAVLRDKKLKQFEPFLPYADHFDAIVEMLEDQLGRFDDLSIFEMRYNKERKSLVGYLIVKYLEGDQITQELINHLGMMACEVRDTFDDGWRETKITGFANGTLCTDIGYPENIRIPHTEIRERWNDFNNEAQARKLEALPWLKEII